MFCPRCGKNHAEERTSCDVCGMNLEFITLFDAEELFPDIRPAAAAEKSGKSGLNRKDRAEARTGRKLNKRWFPSGIPGAFLLTKRIS